MRKRYNYFVDKKQVSRKDFVEELKKWSYRIKQVDVIAGWCGIDMEVFDEEMFKEGIKTVNAGRRWLVPRSNGCKEFYRKEV